MLDESPILCVAQDGGLKLGDLPFILEPQFSPQPTPKKDLVSRIQRSGEDFFGSPPPNPSVLSGLVGRGRIPSSDYTPDSPLPERTRRLRAQPAAAD